MGWSRQEGFLERQGERSPVRTIAVRLNIGIAPSRAVLEEQVRKEGLGRTESMAEAK